MHLRFTIRDLLWPTLVVALALKVPRLPIARADETTPEQAAAAFIHSTQLVRNYDIQWTGTSKRLLKPVVERQAGKVLEHWEPFEPGEIPPSSSLRSRQVVGDTLRYRTETLDPVTGNCTKLRLSDGTSAAKWDAQRKVAMITRPTSQLVDEGFHYSDLYCNASGGAISLAEVFAPQNNIRRIDYASTPQRYVIVAVSTAFGWQLSLDPKNGFLPTRIDQFVRTHDRLVCRIELTKFKPIGEVAVPVKATITLFDANPQSRTFHEATEVREYTVDLDKSRWNSDIDRGEFIAKFPEGTDVLNTLEPRKPTDGRSGH
jgi:hypothetical protein